jgi:hypothetical protein
MTTNKLIVKPGNKIIAFIRTEPRRFFRSRDSEAKATEKPGPALLGMEDELKRLRRMKKNAILAIGHKLTVSLTSNSELR